MVSEHGAIARPMHNIALNALDDQRLLIGTRAAFLT